MLIGIISDVHSNAVALKEVLSALEKVGVEKILHAGDIVGYNPYPDETIRMFRDENIISILGNHDRALITADVSGFNPYAAAALEWTQDVISNVSVGYIRGLKPMESIIEGAKTIVMIHGGPYDIDEYIYPDDAVPELFDAVDGDILVLGHTHIQFKKEYARGIIINPGSVGQPRDRNPDAAFAIFDTASGKVEFKRVSYDIEKVIKDMLEAHLPEKLALRLRVGR